MKRFFVASVVIIAALLAPPAYAQQGLVSGPLNSQVAVCNPASPGTACLFLPLSASTNTVGLTVAGTYSGTLQFEASADGGTTWVAISSTPSSGGSAVTSTTSTGTWTAPVAGYSFIRVRCSTYSSGVATVSLNPSQAVTPSSGSGAGVSSLTGDGKTFCNSASTGAVTLTPCFTPGYLATAMTAQSTATPTPVTNMAWNLLASKNYLLKCDLPINLSASATIAFDLNGPGTPTSYTLTQDGGLGAAGAYKFTQAAAAAAWATATGASGVPGVASIVHITGAIQNGVTASGTQLQLRSIGNGTNSFTIGADAVCTLAQLN